MSSISLQKTPLFASLMLGSALASGCNRYEMFNVAGYEQAAFSNEADVVFLIDNSSSMTDEAADLALNFNVFIDKLTSVDENQATATLTDAVENYVAYTQQRGQFMDYRLGITTTSVDYDDGFTEGVDPGEAGLLLGDPTVMSKGDADLQEDFQRNLLCYGIAWNPNSLDYAEDDYECGDDPGGVITHEYLDCVCGDIEWDENDGSGQEEHLEAVLMTLCRSVEEPPEACYDAQSPFAETEDLVNDDFLRDDSTIVFVIASDEGDTSRRLAQGEDDISEYLDAIEAFDRRIRFAIVGPPYDPEEGSLTCNSGNATTWGVVRLRDLSDYFGGFYNYIADGTGDDDEDCEATDFAEHLEDLGDLLNNLVTAFTLDSIPDVTTIRVWIDDAEINEALPVSEDEETHMTYDNGWSYDPAQNAVVFWGEAIPDYNQNVRIYYRPLEGKPRDLPPI